MCMKAQGLQCVCAWRYVYYFNAAGLIIIKRGSLQSRYESFTLNYDMINEIVYCRLIPSSFPNFLSFSTITRPQHHHHHHPRRPHMSRRDRRTAELVVRSHRHPHFSRNQFGPRIIYRRNLAGRTDYLGASKCRSDG